MIIPAAADHTELMGIVDQTIPETGISCAGVVIRRVLWGCMLP